MSVAGSAAHEGSAIGPTLAERATAAAGVAARHAAAVDRDARFPREAIAELRRQGLLGLLIPDEFGGPGGDLREAMDVAAALGRACASTAMIFAMHQLSVICLARHGAASPWIGDFLRRAARAQPLIASTTTEGTRGGEVRSSDAAIVAIGDRIRLTREASVISYGEAADALITLAKRAPDAPAADQVLAVFERGDYRLARTGEWDTLGMRGTCSAGFRLEASGAPGQVVAEPYAAIHAQAMVPAAHLLWSSVWLGIAVEAAERTRLHLRAAARGRQGPAPGAAHFQQATRSVGLMRARLAAGLTRWRAQKDDRAAIGGLEAHADFALLKLEAADLAVATVRSALQACGLAGYRNDGPTSLGRLLRDVLSAPIMINNDRILADLAAPMLLIEPPAGTGL